MTNGFEMHGLGHLSASSLNVASSELPLFLMERLLGFRSGTNAAMARGKAAEEGVHLGLLDPKLPLEMCVGRALSAFDTEMRFAGDDKREKERDMIPGYVENGLAALAKYDGYYRDLPRIDLLNSRGKKCGRVSTNGKVWLGSGDGVQVWPPRFESAQIGASV